MKNQDYVLASEIADYVYCQCCFFDKLEGRKKTTLEMEQGTVEHEAVADQLSFLEMLKNFALWLIVASGFLILLTLILWKVFKLA